MLYRIAHWYGKQPPVPDAVKIADATDKLAVQYQIEVEDIHAFVKEHGEIKLVPPGRYGDDWLIWVTDRGRWYQC